ncbi:MAG: hypothetical protein ABR574_12400, partial [Cryomorphaceae bacterium]
HVFARLKSFEQSRTRFGVSEATPDLFRGKRSNPGLAPGLTSPSALRRSSSIRPSAELKRQRYFFRTAIR